MDKRPAFWMPLIAVMAVHGCLVAIGVGITFIAAFVTDGRLPFLDLVADLMTWALCLPVQVFVDRNRLDLFFMLLPLNSVCYGVAIWAPVYLFRKLKGSGPAEPER